MAGRTDDDGRDILGHHARQLTEEERRKLKGDNVLVSDYRRHKFEKEAKKNWDLFYKRNSTHFFKDRHWITREFPELLEAPSGVLLERGAEPRRKTVLLEAGCGVGNTVFPLLAERDDLFVYACDFSTKAIELLQTHSEFDPKQCSAFVCDLTRQPLSTLITGSIDIASLFFVLSAINPEKMVDVLKNVFEVLDCGGLLLMRDYGLFDHAQLRFSKGHKLQENFYARQDGTMAYYFSEEKVALLAEEAGFEVLANGYVQKETVNHKENISAPRIFVQAKLRKPLTRESEK